MRNIANKRRVPITLIEDQEIIVTIDSQRSVSVCPTDKGTVTLGVEDPHVVAVVELSLEDLAEVITALKRTSIYARSKET